MRNVIEKRQVFNVSSLVLPTANGAAGERRPVRRAFNAYLEPRYDGTRDTRKQKKGHLARDIEYCQQIALAPNASKRSSSSLD